jgi:hypothetical protein
VIAGYPVDKGGKQLWFDNARVTDVLAGNLRVESGNFTDFGNSGSPQLTGGPCAANVCAFGISTGGFSVSRETVSVRVTQQVLEDLIGFGF